MQNFYDGIDQYGDKTAVITQQYEKITYSQLIEEADQLVQGAKSRKLAFLICGNTLEALVAYIGCLRKKIIPVLINDNTEIIMLNHLCDRYRPEYIFIEKNADWPVGSDMKYDLLKVYRNFRFFRMQQNEAYPVSEELGLLLTTSGSTGSPKLVRQSYQNICSNAASIAKYLNITDDDRAIMTLPMSYTYGLSIINSHLLKGACIIMNSYTLMDKEFWRLLKEEGATTFGGVPYIYEMLRKLRFERMELPSLRYITQAGGRLSAEMAREFNRSCAKKGIRLVVMYGQTEATARMSYLPWEWAEKKAGSMGIAIPGGEFCLIDADNKRIDEADVTGELVYKGPNVTLGYAESYTDLIKGDERGGVLYTGDMAKRDADGFYYIVGRKKRFLKIYGNRVNLDEVEGLLKAEGYECVCCGVDDHMKIYATHAESVQEIISYISGRLHLSKAAFEVKIIERIPRNEAGKILYSKLENE